MKKKLKFSGVRYIFVLSDFLKKDSKENNKEQRLLNRDAIGSIHIRSFFLHREYYCNMNTNNIYYNFNFNSLVLSI